MKGGINFEFKAGNIVIDAPVDTPKHLMVLTRPLVYLAMLPDIIILVGFYNR